jgi:hypothetical protein
MLVAVEPPPLEGYLEMLVLVAGQRVALIQVLTTEEQTLVVDLAE